MMPRPLAALTPAMVALVGGAAGWYVGHGVRTAAVPAVPVADGAAAVRAVPAADGAAAARAPSAADGAAAAQGRSQPIAPVYAATLAGPPDPLAERLCRGLHALPESRRAQCCAAAPAIVLTDECTRVLTQSVRAGALRLDASDIEACSAAIAESLGDCGWVGPFPPALPAACTSALHGALAEGARCRSSLECAGTLRCRGAGPTATGRCGAPLPDGEICALAVDPLASYVRHDSVDREHPECAGYCERHRCQPAVPLGAACEQSTQCVAGAHCRAGRCAPGRWAGAGEACTGADCAPGSRCFEHRCIVPRDAGACGSDFECRGGCVGAGARTCGMRCDLR